MAMLGGAVLFSITVNDELMKIGVWVVASGCAGVGSTLPILSVATV